TRPPARSRAAAVAAPIPRDAPVTSAVRSASGSWPTPPSLSPKTALPWRPGPGGNDRVIERLVGPRSLGIVGVVRGDRLANPAGFRPCPGRAGCQNVECHDRGAAQGCPLADHG